MPPRRSGPRSPDATLMAVLQHFNPHGGRLKMPSRNPALSHDLITSAAAAASQELASMREQQLISAKTIEQERLARVEKRMRRKEEEERLKEKIAKEEMAQFVNEQKEHVDAKPRPKRPMSACSKLRDPIPILETRTATPDWEGGVLMGSAHPLSARSDRPASARGSWRVRLTDVPPNPASRTSQWLNSLPTRSMEEKKVKKKKVIEEEAFLLDAPPPFETAVLPKPKKVKKKKQKQDKPRQNERELADLALKKRNESRRVALLEEARGFGLELAELAEEDEIRSAMVAFLIERRATLEKKGEEDRKAEEARRLEEEAKAAETEAHFRDSLLKEADSIGAVVADDASVDDLRRAIVDTLQMQREEAKRKAEEEARKRQEEAEREAARLIEIEERRRQHAMEEAMRVQQEEDEQRRMQEEALEESIDVRPWIEEQPSLTLSPERVVEISVALDSLAADLSAKPPTKRFFKSLESACSGSELDAPGPSPSEMIRAVAGRASRWFRPADPETGWPPSGFDRIWGLAYAVEAPQTRPEVADVVQRAIKLLEGGWTEMPADSSNEMWNLLWTWKPPRIPLHSVLMWQKVNHFPGSRELTRKDRLRRHIQRKEGAPGKAGQSFTIMPSTFVLPVEYTQFVSEFARTEEEQGDNVWIVKPARLSRGRGIFLINSLEKLLYSDASVVQRYILHPLLLNGHKFDLRIYVLVTSFSPLEAFVYNEGFCRFCTLPYSPDPEMLSNKHMHLTNTSIQRHVRVDGEEPQTKTSFAELRARLTDKGVNIDQLWGAVDAVIVKSLICVRHAIPSPKCCFEVFGYDVIFDETLRPWLLEVNASPSMEILSELDAEIKPRMVADAIRLVNPLPFDRKRVQASFEKKGGGGRWVLSSSEEADAELKGILGGRVPRLPGEVPAEMGGWRRLHFSKV